MSCHPLTRHAPRPILAFPDTRLAISIIHPPPRTNPEVMLLKGIALIRDGDPDLGERLITKARDAARSPLKERAELALVKAQLDANTLPLGQAIKRLEHRSEEHTSELQSLMRISYAVFCLKTKNKVNTS